MELIKKIKQAEAQARQIIDQSKADAAKKTDDAAKKHRDAVEQAEISRKKAIEAAIADAQSRACDNITKLQKQAEKDMQQTRDKTSGKMAAATTMVLDYLKG